MTAAVKYCEILPNVEGQDLKDELSTTEFSWLEMFNERLLCSTEEQREEALVVVDQH